MSLDEKVRTPVVDYTSIKINGVDILLSSTARASFISPYNKIYLTYSPDISLSQFLVRVTGENEDYDIDLGTRVIYRTSLAANTSYSDSIDVNATNFSKGDGTYRVGLYAQSMLDHSWDVTYLFFTVDGDTFIPKDSTGYEVLTNKDISE